VFGGVAGAGSKGAGAGAGAGAGDDDGAGSEDGEGGARKPQSLITGEQTFEILAFLRGVRGHAPATLFQVARAIGIDEQADDDGVTASRSAHAARRVVAAAATACGAKLPVLPVLPAQPPADTGAGPVPTMLRHLHEALLDNPEIEIDTSAARGAAPGSASKEGAGAGAGAGAGGNGMVVGLDIKAERLQQLKTNLNRQQQLGHFAPAAGPGCEAIGVFPNNRGGAEAKAEAKAKKKPAARKKKRAAKKKPAKKRAPKRQKRARAPSGDDDSDVDI